MDVPSELRRADQGVRARRQPGATGPRRRRVLLVGDGEATAAPTHRLLTEHGFAVEAAPDPQTAVDRAGDADVIVLDVAASPADRLEACRTLRAATSAYILAVGDRLSELDAVLNLTVGADDYLGQPVHTAELIARVHAMLRRPRHLTDDPPVLRVDDLEIDTGAREVRVDGRPVPLSTLEYELLTALAENPKLTLSRKQLLEHVWGPTWYGNDHVIDVHISNLRRKLGDDPHTPRYIRTVRGYGFRIGARSADVRSK